jgi:outer membrane receptor protein involved in Fe transport
MKTKHTTAGLLLTASILSSASAQSNSKITATDLPEIIVTASRSATLEPWVQSPSGVGEVSVITAKEIAAKPAAKIEDLLQSAGLAAGDASSNFGLTPSLGMRGFTVNNQGGAPSLVPSNILLNGHADIANSFTRDMSTVERIEVMGGFDSTMLGAGTPAGAVQYQSKRPQGIDGLRVDTTLASDGLKRLTVDAEKDFDALQVRAVVASQRGQKTVEGQGTDRDNVLVSSRLATPIGTFRLDLEHQNNRAPYTFGTFYANGQFWYDKPYVSPQSQASRSASRAALYFDNKISENTLVKAWLQQSYVSRAETLVGFWDIKDANNLDGYYRVKTSTYHQQDVGVSVDHASRLFGLPNTVTVLAQSQTQNLDFNGPQSIAGYTISIQNPTYPIDLSVLTLKPRTFNEQYRENGLAVADAVHLTDAVELRVGTRLSGVHIDTASNTPVSKPTADMHRLTNSEGLSYQATKENKFWISRAESFAPVRGQTRDGGYLPPLTATQYEAGFKRQTHEHRFIATIFAIQQNNLPATDPVDKNYLIPLGGMASSGLTLSDKTSWQGVTIQANATFQNTKITTPVSSSQGVIVAGVPRALGAIKLSSPEKQQGFESWVSAIGQGRRSADDTGTVYASGFVRLDTGMSYKTGRWQLAAWIQNLADLRYVQALNAVDNVWQGARRSVSVNASYQY